MRIKNLFKDAATKVGVKTNVYASGMECFLPHTSILLHERREEIGFIIHYLSHYLKCFLRINSLITWIFT